MSPVDNGGQSGPGSGNGSNDGSGVGGGQATGAPTAGPQQPQPQQGAQPAQQQSQQQTPQQAGAQGVNPQLQLQQVSTSGNLHGSAQTAGNQTANQMAQLQVIQQPLQNQTYLPQVYTNQGSQLIMPSNLTLHQPGMNPQIQVIAAPGKPFQSNQINAPQMLTAASYTIPNSSNNNQAYIIGPWINSAQGNFIQHHSQAGKPGEMPKQQVISPQIGSQLQWATPQFLTTGGQNQILIRGSQTDQMFIQPQQSSLQNNANVNSQQHFTMPLSSGPLTTTSLASGAISSLPQAQQQGNNQQVQQANGAQGTQPGQIQSANLVSINKSQATLQPKPPVQIQPQPNSQGHPQFQTPQQLPQQVQLTMNSQGQPHLQMVTGGASSQILTQAQSHGGIQAQVVQQNAQLQQGQQGARQLTILPQQSMTSQAQIQQNQVTFTSSLPHQQATQLLGQAQTTIRPNIVQVTVASSANTAGLIVGNPVVSSAVTNGVTATTNQSMTQQSQVQLTPQKSKSRKLAVGKNVASSPSGSQPVIQTSQPQQQATTATKTLYGRSPIPTSIGGNTTITPTSKATLAVQQTVSQSPVQTTQSQNPTPHSQNLNSQTTIIGSGVTKVPIPSSLAVSGIPMMTSNSAAASQSVSSTPLKTINISALQRVATNLPDATLTPLIPNVASSQNTPVSAASNATAQVQVLPTSVANLPNPAISITPTGPPPPSTSTAQGAPLSQPLPSTPVKKEVKQEPPSLTPAPASESKQRNNNESEKENSNKVSKLADEEDSTSKLKLPKALVKPQVLTHVIEGFVIQEAAEPFPISKDSESEEPPKKKVALGSNMAKCENCGKVDDRSKFKKNKRFCSSACSKSRKNQQHQQSQVQMSVSTGTTTTLTSPATNGAHKTIESKVSKKGNTRKWVDLPGTESTDETTSSSGDASSMSPAITENHEEDPKMNPMKWNVTEVVDFVRNLPGCAEYADDFALQEIDGQALMLLKEDHLMSAIGMKLGPALKLCARIEQIKSSNSSGEPSAAKA